MEGQNQQRAQDPRPTPTEHILGVGIAGQLATSMGIAAMLEVLSKRLGQMDERLAILNGKVEQLIYLQTPKRTPLGEPLNAALYAVDQTLGQELYLDLGTGNTDFSAFATSDAPLRYVLSMSDDMDHWFTVHSETTNSLVFIGRRVMQYLRFISDPTDVAGTVSLSLTAL